MPPIAVRLVLYALFAVSGAAGLLYEALWARYLGLFVGHSAYAQVIVLAIFLGGMAGGALVAGQRSHRLADPLRWYARIELAVAVLGVAFHPVYDFVTSTAYDAVFPALAEGPVLTVTKWAIAALLILPQSLLLGATFPLMGAGLLRRFPELPGRTLSILYFANSIGAAVGVLVAGFWFIALAGLPGTLLIAAALNAAAGLGAFAISATPPVPTSPAAPPATGTGAVGTSSPRGAEPLERLLLAVAFGTAVASFIYEIGWIRMLSLVLGSATHAFELMLSAFILGLALGSFWVRSRADRWSEPVRALGIVQLVMGTAALATLPLYASSFQWMAWLMHAATHTDAGYAWYSVARYGICLAIMLPATFCAGVTLPLITRILVVRRLGERAIGRVYGWNTLGSILGVVTAGLLILPLVGLKRTLALGAVCDLALGIALLRFWGAAHPAAKRVLLAVASGAAVLAAVALFGADFDRRLLASAVYRNGAILPPEAFQSLYHRDGRTATVSAHRDLRTDEILLATNGKPDASLPASWLQPCVAGVPGRPLDSDAATQALAPLITLAHAPGARNAAVIGMGSGMSSHFMLDDPNLESVVTVEIEPAMVEGARVFYPANRRAYDDPRSTIVYDDAKSYFASAGRAFDVIVSEPSNPWVSGVANLFSAEFYDRVTRFLTDEGVFGQWFHLYEIDDGLVLSVLAALHEHFRTFAIYQTWNADIVIVATRGDRLPTPDWSLFSGSAVRNDLCHTVELTPRMLRAALLVDYRALAPVLEQWHPNSDFYPVLDLGAERTRFMRTAARGFLELGAARFDFAAVVSGRTSPPTDEVIAPIPRIPGMAGLALSAGLRHPAAASAVDTLQRPASLDRWQFLVQRWRAVLSSGMVPADWIAWLADFTAVERAVHAGVHGMADQVFYADVDAFVRRTDAPSDVRAAVAFRHGLAAWDFAEVSTAGDALLPGVLRGEQLVAPGEFLDGFVTAKLVTGAPHEARRAFAQLVPLTGRSLRDLRLLLLNAYIVRSGAE